MVTAEGLQVELFTPLSLTRRISYGIKTNKHHALQTLRNCQKQAYEKVTESHEIHETVQKFNVSQCIQTHSTVFP